MSEKTDNESVNMPNIPTWPTKLSEETGKSIGCAYREAERFCYQHAGLAHILIGVMDAEDKRTKSLFEKLGIDAKKFTKDIEGKIRQHYKEQEIPPKFQISEALVAAFEAAERYSGLLGSQKIMPEHLVYAVSEVLEGKKIALKPEETDACGILKAYNLSSNRINDTITAQ